MLQRLSRDTEFVGFLNEQVQLCCTRLIEATDMVLLHRQQGAADFVTRLLTDMDRAQAQEQSGGVMSA